MNEFIQFNDTVPDDLLRGFGHIPGLELSVIR